MILNPFSAVDSGNNNETLYVNTTANDKTFNNIPLNSLIIVGILGGYNEYGYKSSWTSGGEQTFNICCSGIFVGNYPNTKINYIFMTYKTMNQTDELGNINYNNSNKTVTLYLKKYTFAYVKTFNKIS